MVRINRDDVDRVVVKGLVEVAKLGIIGMQTVMGEELEVKVRGRNGYKIRGIEAVNYIIDRHWENIPDDLRTRVSIRAVSTRPENRGEVLRGRRTRI